MSCLAPDQPKRFCKECQLQGYPEQEIIILSTYGGRDTNVLNLDGSKHYHLFSFETYIFQHYEDDSIEISSRPEWMKNKRCGNGRHSKRKGE